MGLLKKVLALTAIAGSLTVITKAFNRDSSDKPVTAGNDNSDKNTTDNDTNGKDKTSDRTVSRAPQNDTQDRTQKMFKDLGMTEKQKRKYTESIKTIKGEWAKANPGQQFDNKKVLSEEERALNSILDEVQYGMYRDWAKKYEY